jgi:hypothetical protein
LELKKAGVTAQFYFVKLQEIKIFFRDGIVNSPISASTSD